MFLPLNIIPASPPPSNGMLETYVAENTSAFCFKYNQQDAQKCVLRLTG